MTTFAIATLGCKVNTYESQGYETALLDKGYTQVSFKKKRQIYILLIPVQLQILQEVNQDKRYMRQLH